MISERFWQVAPNLALGLVLSATCSGALASNLGKIDCSDANVSGERFICDYAIIHNKYERFLQSLTEAAQETAEQRIGQMHDTTSKCQNLTCVEHLIDAAIEENKIVQIDAAIDENKIVQSAPAAHTLQEQSTVPIASNAERTAETVTPAEINPTESPLKADQVIPTPSTGDKEHASFLWLGIFILPLLIAFKVLRGIYRFFFTSRSGSYQPSETSDESDIASDSRPSSASRKGRAPADRLTLKAAPKWGTSRDANPREIRLIAGNPSCASCDFWGGARAASETRMNVIVVNSDIRGKCFAAGRPQGNLSPYHTCKKWKIWPQLS